MNEFSSNLASRESAHDENIELIEQGNSSAERESLPFRKQLVRRAFCFKEFTFLAHRDLQPD
jgi:hypothetical protein